MCLRETTSDEDGVWLVRTNFLMGNCASCGQNGAKGHAKGCKLNTKISRWARYRLRLKKKAAVYVLEPDATPSDIRAAYDRCNRGDTIVVMPVHKEKLK